MSWTIIIGCAGIILARIGDVSLGALRTVAVVSGHRGWSWIFGLVEVTIWVFVVSAVIANIQAEPVYGVAYAIGAATGSYVGVTLMRYLPFGHQVVRVFTREGSAMLNELRLAGFIVTKFHGEGRDGPVNMLFVQVRRNQTRHVIRVAREVDPKCFYTVDDIRVAHAVRSLK